MIPTADLRTELRVLIGDEIPVGGTETDVYFTDAQIDKILTNSANLYLAAAEGWRKKAAKMLQKLGEVEEYSVGDETYKKVNLQTAINTAHDMVKMYENLAKTVNPTNTGSMILKIKPPEVL